MSYGHLAAARAAGFGDYFKPGWDVGVGLPPPSDPSWGGDSSSNNVPWYLSAVPLATVIGKTAASIWGNNQPEAGYSPAHTDYAALQAQALAQARTSGGGGVGIGVDGNGIRLSDGSHIGWLPIGGVLFAFFLLQSKGFSRR